MPTEEHNAQGGSHDHPYSRTRTDTTTTSSSVIGNMRSYVNNQTHLINTNHHQNVNLISLTSQENYISPNVHFTPELINCNTSNDHSDNPVFDSGSGSGSEHLHNLSDEVNKNQSLHTLTPKPHLLPFKTENKSILRASLNRQQSSIPLTSTHHHSMSSQEKSLFKSSVNDSQHIPTPEPSQNCNSLNLPKGKAEVKQIVLVKIIDQIIYEGNIVKETTFDQQKIIRSLGSIDWPDSDSISFKSSNSGNLADISSSETNKTSQSNNSSQPNSQQLKSICEDTLPNTISPPSTKSKTKSTLSVNKRFTQIKTNNSLNKSRQLTNQQQNSETIINQVNTAQCKSPHLNQTNPSNTTKRRISSEAKAQNSKKVKTNTNLGTTITNTNNDFDQDEAATTLLSLFNKNGALKETSIIDNSSSSNSIEPIFKEEPEFSPLHVGSRVFAKWMDKNFYPGKVVNSDSGSRWKVHFDDGGTRIIHESEIISVPYLCVGQRVFVTYSSGLCIDGVIKGHRKEDEDLDYIIEYFSIDKLKEERFNSSSVFLTSDLASSLLGKQTKLNAGNVYAGLDLNNIIPKTSRIAVKQSLNNNETNDQNEDTVITKVNRKKLQDINNESIILDESSSNGSIIIEKKSTSNNNRNVNKSSIIATSLPSPIQQSSSSLSSPPFVSLRTLNGISKTLPPAEVEKLLGPLPPEGSQLFTGLGFLLITGNSENEGERSVNDAGRSTLFDAPYLIKQIEHGSGKYYENFEDKNTSLIETKETLLIACSYFRSPEYMQALAAGIPCIQHTWIVECCRQKQLLKRDNYILPSGFSRYLKKLQSDRSVFKKSATLFRGTKIFFASNQSKLANTWKPVLQAANATILQSLPTSIVSSTRKTSNKIDLIIADSTCPSNILMKAAQQKIPIVSIEYVIECLIVGRKLHYEHENFHYQFKP